MEVKVPITKPSLIDSLPNNVIEAKEAINNILEINFRDKFNTRRGRINCSIKDNVGWRWFGVQFVVKNIKEN